MLGAYKRPDDYVQGEGAPKILVQYTKARHLSGNDMQDIEVEMHNENGKMRWTWEQGNIAYQKAVEMLKNKISLRDVAEELDISKSTIGRWKSKAQNEGLL